MTKIPWPNPVYIVFPNPAHNGKPPAVHIKTPELMRECHLFSVGNPVLCKSKHLNLSRYPNRHERYGEPREYTKRPEGRLCQKCAVVLRDLAKYFED